MLLIQYLSQGTYFFITSGLTLIGIAILSLLSDQNFRIRNYKSERRTLIRFATFMFFGLGLALTSIMIDTNSWSNFGESAWVLPLVLFCYLIGKCKSTSG